ncbi:T9SS type A sorting domain-containing protein [Hymenobacter aerilatus]|uniref:T9SS type A sorting domain-containing protein n=1 Tax=Hymenobacter aerilatus TaxID=2932251 RepID=A0A8T9SQ30_9BACT|nr:choice-of-anchor J domain-containing protein [Hymenobacter aerilatus]UOR04258.1 T9SS type A sorting domain-containing protein [Hymenobacter aerilatus]
MTQPYSTDTRRTRKRHWALAALLALGATSVHAQSFTYRSASIQSLIGTYTDLGTAGTVITTDNTDDANSAVQTIGFTFNYNGQSFTQFVLNTNGYLKLGSEAPSAALYFDGSQVTTGGPFNSTAATDVNLLVPFNTDWLGTPTTEYRVAVTGTAPNRVCTVQWKDVKDKARATTATGTTVLDEQFATVSFQVKLYETTNNIEFTYGNATAGAGTDAAKYGAVGVKGSSNANGQLITLVKGSTTAWLNASPQDANYPVANSNGFNFRKTVLPATGATFRFRPTPPNDAAVVAIHTLSQLPIPSATPHVMQAVVQNLGLNTLTNVPVTVAVTGANTFSNTKTVASLLPGQTTIVAFDAFTPTVTGTNTVTVTLPADGIIDNNTLTTTQAVNNTTYSYATAGPAALSLGGLVTTPQAFLARYTASTPRLLTSVNIDLEGGASAVGRNVYAIVTDKAGRVLGRSDAYTIATSDIGKYHAFALTAPVVVGTQTTEFLVGLVQQSLAASATDTYFPLGVQRETPTRRATFFRLTLGDNSAPADLAINNYGKFMIEAVTTAATCLPPTALAATATAPTAASVSFTPPAGVSNFSVVYGPTGFDPATTAGTTVSATASPVALTGLTPSTAYQVYIRSACSATDQSVVVGPVAFTTPCTPPAPLAAFPYNQNFDGVTAPALPCGFTVVDANTDGFTWTNGTAAARSPANALTYNFNNQSLTTAADDWVFTPALSLTAAQQYLLSFYYRVGSATTPERLEIKVGNAPTVAGMTTTIYTNNNLTATAFTQATAQPIRVATDGTYYVGMHVTSAANSFRLSIDDVTLTAGPLAVNQALSQAVAAYPNPTTGLLNVDLRSSKARQAYATVVNALGQTVMTRMLSTKQPDQLDLATLAAGIYTLKLELDGETAVKRISVQK